MKTLPLFLMLLAIFTVGCQAASPAPSVKAPVAVSSAKTAARPPASPLTLYNEELANGPLARMLRGEAVPEVVEFMCIQTGNFNLSPDDEKLLFQTMCVERNPTSGKVRVLHVRDSIAMRLPGKHVFRIQFQDSVVSVQDLGRGKREVVLHYRDGRGTFHEVTLPEQNGKEYRYSFANLTPDTVEPIGEIRTLEIER